MLMLSVSFLQHASAPQTLQTAFEPQEPVAKKNHQLLSQFKEELEDNLLRSEAATPSGDNASSDGQGFREMLEKMASRNEAGSGDERTPMKIRKRRAR